MLDRTESGLLFPKHFNCQAGDISFHKISSLNTNDHRRNKKNYKILKKKIEKNLIILFLVRKTSSFLDSLDFQNLPDIKTGRDVR